ncbi:hypothetical protein BG011_007860 [Mortierella polycephala]|uniref:Uncharacterized protein n=1 Tax=Mortierella polycephala TaxID=41804 RepID=A0A9P6TY26_9FUNG|nr:hypothetical protein BG011_007860 [Mortierella polycephala]
MTKTVPPPPQLSIKTLIKPTTIVCLLALSLCTPTTTTGLPIRAPSSPSIPTDTQPQSVDTTSSSANAGSPFRTVSRPITIQFELSATPNPPSALSSDPYALLIQHTELQEQFLRHREQQNQEELARLQEEQDQLEKEEQDRDQLLDNQEEELQDQDPETVRRRQEESLGLWMTDSELDALSQGVSNDEDGQNSDDVLIRNKGNQFDLYAEDFTEALVSPEEVEEQRLNAPSVLSTRSSSLAKSERRQLPTEEEMLQWPISNHALFEDRQDEVQDEYDEQA